MRVHGVQWCDVGVGGTSGLMQPRNGTRKKIETRKNGNLGREKIGLEIWQSPGLAWTESGNVARASRIVGPNLAQTVENRCVADPPPIHGIRNAEAQGPPWTRAPQWIRRQQHRSCVVWCRGGSLAESVHHTHRYIDSVSDRVDDRQADCRQMHPRILNLKTQPSNAKIRGGGLQEARVCKLWLVATGAAASCCRGVEEGGSRSTLRLR